jgi:pilus assembly protein CpaB
MFLRNVLLAVGAAFVLAGVVVLFAFFGQVRKPAGGAETPVENRQAVMVAKRAIPAGKLQGLENDDFDWKDIAPGEVQPGTLQRGQEKDFLGAIPQHDFAEGEPLIASDFARKEQQRSLAADLRPGYRAVSIFVDAAQSVAGLLSRGDYVDVILIQSFDDKVTADPRRKTVGETVLQNVRVIALDQTLNPQSGIVGAISVVSAEARIPKTVTLELFEWQAEKLLVAEKLGSFQLAVRPLKVAAVDSPEEKRNAAPVWASNVSPALDELAAPRPQLVGIEPPPTARDTAARQVSVRVYSGRSGTEGYLCSKSSCVRSDVNTVTSEVPSQTNLNQQ